MVISTYAADCRETAWQEAPPPIINTATHNGDHFVFSAVQSPNARQPRGAPSRQIGGGFLLCVADVIRRVPLDPELDGIFAGAVVCAICYAQLDGAGRLSTAQCRTCDSGCFHKSCLLKWFGTSGDSTCPLCRSAWQWR